MSNHTEIGATDPRTLRAIRKAIRGNAHCVPGLLFRDRVVATPHGALSHEHDQELLALLDGGINYTFWYGHVVRGTPAPEAGSDPIWVALIVSSSFFVDAPTVDLLFQRYAYAMRDRCEYTPAWAQDPEDVFAIRPSFDEACRALAEMIRRFDQDLRDSRSVVEGMEKWDGEYGSDHMVESFIDPPGRQDLRSFDVYGLALKKDHNGVFLPSPRYGFSSGKKP